MAQTLLDVSGGLASAVEAAGSGVVRVAARRRLAATGVIWSADGLIVTSNHVVRKDEDIKIGLPNGEKVTASLVGRDPTTDLALLRVDATFDVPDWQTTDELRVGNLVLAVGRPGKSAQATLGIVSALGDSWRTSSGGQINRYLQTDVVMYPGFSGGPLVGVSGEIWGLNTSALRRGVSLTVPTGTIRPVVAALLEHGRIRRGYLGVGGQPVRLPDGIAETYNQEMGVLLVSVDEGPAQAGGLTLGDTIITFNGEAVRHVDDLLALLIGDTVGAEVTIVSLRGGEIQEFTVTVGERG